MRDWHDFILKKENKNTLDRFDYSDEVFQINNKNFKENFEFENFKNNELCIKIYTYLKNVLKKKQIFFIGSSWGRVEYFLSKNFPLIASDIAERYVNFHKTNTKLNYIKFDILEENINIDFRNKYEQIVVNNIEYLFDQNQLQKFLINLSLIAKKDADIYIIFRSKDSFLIKIIDNYLLPFESLMVKQIKNLSGQKVFLTKNHHGYRRNEKDFISTINRYNFEFKSIHREMFETEYKRLRILRYFGISKLLSIMFFKFHPHLNIIHLKKK
tara:strand:+ start:119 stop:928 length:810 start_codon:yes stop_codon:yes gene_type:complete